MSPAAPDQPPEWPDAGNGTVPADDKAKAVFTAQVGVVSAAFTAMQERATAAFTSDLTQAGDEAKAQADSFRALKASERTADLENLAKFFETISALSVASVDRGRAGAEVVQKASAAIVALYTGILALTFAAGDNPLPARGVLAPIFLGLAVVLSTAYLAYMTRSQDIASGPAAVAGVEPKTYSRLNVVTTVASRIATRRSYCLRAAVISLGVGLALIALPFITFGSLERTTGSSSPSVPAWPTPAAGIPDALNAIVYKAQVDEVAAARKSVADAASAPKQDDATVLGGILVAGLVLTFGVPAVWKNQG